MYQTTEIHLDTSSSSPTLNLHTQSETTMSTSNNRQRVALVTGCSEPNSLGVATVKHLQSKGWKVIATARKVETMKALKATGVEVGLSLPLEIVS